MNLKRNLIFFFVCSCLLGNISSAATINAIKSDMWSDPTTWDLDRIPMPEDIVVINGFVVTADIDATVTDISISNATFNDSYLILSTGGVTLTVSGNVSLTATNCNKAVALEMSSTDSMYVGGSVTCIRQENATANRIAKIEIGGESRLTIEGDLNYEYKTGKDTENYDEIEVIGNAELRVKGNVNITQNDGGNWSFYSNQNGKAIFENNVTINLTGGRNFSLELKGSSTMAVNGDFSLDNANTKETNSDATIMVGDGDGFLKIDGDLNLTSSIDKQTAFLTTKGVNASTSIRGNINLMGTAEGNVGTTVETGAIVYLGGNIQRMSANKFGVINMDTNSTWVYDGNTSQTIACTDMPGNGTDAFNFANIEFNNTAGLPMVLEGNLVIDKELILDEGIMETSSTAMVVIADQATVTGGSDIAYIDGPMIKQGRTAAAGFTFPTGDNGVYAPLSITEVNSQTAEYTAQYLSCPPPLSGSLDNNSLVNISGTGHWEFSGLASSPDVNVSLHWSDAGAYGILDLNDLVVASWDADSLHWKSIGQSSAVDNGDGSGHVVNMLSCPPPLSGSKLTFGSKDGTNALPVVLSAFRAQPEGQIVKVTWETASEVNSDYFVVERSNNGVNFKEIKKIEAISNADQLTRYATRDMNPEKGSNYYRLCQVDLSGMKVYSRILRVNFETDPGYLVFPNPVKDVLQVRGDFEAKVYELEFFDTSGKLLTRRAAMAEQGFMKLDANQLNLPKPGIYFMRVKQGKSLKTIPFIKD